jgi:hypothetical protein
MMKDIQGLLQNQLLREAKHNSATRASEGVYALCMDLQLDPKKVLVALHQLKVFPEVVRLTVRLFTENEMFEVLTRERLLARRVPNHQSALELAQVGNREALRRVSGRDLQLALQAAKPPEAVLLIEAWNKLSLYEQSRV